MTTTPPTALHQARVVTALFLAGAPTVGIPLALANCNPKSAPVQFLWHTVMDRTGLDRQLVGWLVEETAPFALFIWMLAVIPAVCLSWHRRPRTWAPLLLLLTSVAFIWTMVAAAYVSEAISAGETPFADPHLVQAVVRVVLIGMILVSFRVAWLLVKPQPDATPTAAPAPEFLPHG